MATLPLRKKIELRQADRCPECYRYLGKKEENFTIDYCPNCKVSYPDNLRIKESGNGNNC